MVSYDVSGTESCNDTVKNIFTVFDFFQIWVASVVFHVGFYLPAVFALFLIRSVNLCHEQSSERNTLAPQTVYTSYDLPKATKTNDSSC